MCCCVLGSPDDSFSYHRGHSFTTKDQDNDIWAATVPWSVKEPGGTTLVTTPI